MTDEQWWALSWQERSQISQNIKSRFQGFQKWITRPVKIGRDIVYPTTEMDNAGYFERRWKQVARNHGRD